MHFFLNLEPVHCPMSSSNCCFLTCIQISQESGKVLRYSHLFQNFLQFVVIHTVKDFSVVNEVEVDVPLEFSCFFYDPVDVQSFPASGSFPMIWLFTSGGQNIGASASTSVLLMNIQDWFPLGLTGLISLQSKGLSGVFSNTTVQKHQFFSTQLSL